VLDILNITAYKTNTYEKPSVGETVVVINPKSFTHHHKGNHYGDVPIDAQEIPLTIKEIPPDTISFDIYFDATVNLVERTLLPVSMLPIDLQIKDFKEVCWKYTRDIIKPNFLIIKWGTSVFKCQLASLKCQYTLFEKNGIPIRATVSCTFLTYT